MAWRGTAKFSITILKIIIENTKRFTYTIDEKRKGWGCREAPNDAKLFYRAA
jgi:hypothetical protein